MAAKSKQNTELLELKEFIGDRFNGLDRKIENQTNQLRLEIASVKSELKQDIADVKGDIKGVSEKISGLDKRLSNVEISAQKIPDLAEKVGEFKWWKQTILILSSGSVGAVLAKFFSNQNN